MGEILPQETEYEVLDTRAEAAPPSPYQGMGMLTPAMVRQAEEAVEAVRKVKALALRVTSFADWKKLGPNAYLQKSGAMKVARLFGISFKDMKVSRGDRKKENGDTVAVFTAEVTAEFNGKTVKEIGVVDSEKDFYSSGGTAENGDKITKPFDDRNFANMQKHSVSNAMGRALRSILGLDGIPWEEAVAALGNETASKAGAVSYGGKSAERPPETASDVEIKEKLRSMLLDLADQDPDSASALLKKYTAFKGKDGAEVSVGSVSDKRFSPKWCAATYGKVKKDWESSGFGGPPPEAP